MQVQPCRSAWHLCGCLKLCKHVRFCTPLGFSWIFMVAKSRTSRSFRDIVACLELSVHWVPSVLICFDCFALDFEVEAMWFFQLDYMNGWLLNLLMCIDIGLQKPSKYCTLRSDLMRLDVDLAFFRQGHNNWNTESRHLGSQMRFDDDIRILRYLEDTSPGKLIHTVARGSNSGLPLSTGKVLSLKHRKWRSSSSIRWLQLSVLACIEKDEKVGQKLITAS